MDNAPNYYLVGCVIQKRFEKFIFIFDHEKEGVGNLHSHIQWSGMTQISYILQSNHRNFWADFLEQIFGLRFGPKPWCYVIFFHLDFFCIFASIDLHWGSAKKSLTCAIPIKSIYQHTLVNYICLRFPLNFPCNKLSSYNSWVF